MPRAESSASSITVIPISRGAASSQSPKNIFRQLSATGRGYDGFYFGRFDIRAERVEEFKRGRNFKVIELNGVTSEATSIYDPGNSVFAAYKVLFEQWRIAFEIGAMNRARGAIPTPARILLKWMIDYQEESGSHSQ